MRRLGEVDLHDKVALVTGGSRGLGLVLARELASEGAHLVICARDAEELDRAAQDLAGRGARVLAVPCDVTDAGQVRAMIDVVLRRWGRLDVVINNAGIIGVGPEQEMTLADYRLAMDINFYGPLHVIEAVLPHFRQRREGRLVNITSIGAWASVPHLIPYCASKYAFRGLSEGLRAELAADGIVVTTICPGLMRTGSPRNADFKGQHRKEYTWFALGDSLPGFTMSAEEAAKRIILACKRGEAEVVLSLPAKALATCNALFPGLTADLMGLINRFVLPGPGGIGQARAKGKDSASPLAPSWLTILTEWAAERNNEIAPEEREQTAASGFQATSS